MVFDEEQAKEIFGAPNPLLPKGLTIYEKPPDCPIQGIRFRKQYEFQHFCEPPVDPLGEESAPIGKIKGSLQV
jgi:hypothetical protein